MKLKNPLLVVTDLERSVAFYKEVLGLRKIMDFGANVTLTGGLALQTRESWMQFIDAAPDTLHWGGRVSELYFEEDDDTDVIQVVKTVRCDPLHGRISRDAPLGKAVLGKKVGDHVLVSTEDGGSYAVVIRSITKEQDDGSGSIL